MRLALPRSNNGVPLITTSPLGVGHEETNHGRRNRRPVQP
jgi:hypothetical protein